MKVALVGLPASGKTTVFNALTGAGVDLRSGGRAETHLSVVKVPDPRVERLAEMFSSPKTVHASVEYVDLAGLGEGARGLDDRFLGAVRDADALLLVVRAFPGAPGAPGPDPARELESVHLELTLSDLQVVESRLERLEADLAKGRREVTAERDALVRCRDALEAGTPLRALALEAEEERLLRGYAFLSRKPLSVIFNVGEEERAFAPPKEGGAEAILSQPKTVWTSLCAALEMELLGLGGEAGEFAREMGLETLSRERVIRQTQDLLGLVTFLTANESEARAWPVAEGTTALRAAAEIHSDIQRGFIRAETVAFEDLERAGSWSAARAQGLLRLEGKEYVVREGDVILFRFKV